MLAAANSFYVQIESCLPSHLFFPLYSLTADKNNNNNDSSIDGRIYPDVFESAESTAWLGDLMPAANRRYT